VAAACSLAGSVFPVSAATAAGNGAVMFNKEDAVEADARE